MIIRPVIRKAISLLLVLHLLGQVISPLALALSSASVSRDDNKSGASMHRHRPQQRPLPDKVLVAYTTECQLKSQVLQAVRDGVNVLIWSFFDITQDTTSTTNDGKKKIHIQTNSLGDLDCIRQVIQQLDQEGYDDTVHLTSFGGWNGPHLDALCTAQEWYDAWKEHFGSIFHGIDWDLEGHDDLQSPTNEFSVDCLDKMGQISQYASMDGYCIGVAPPQSYLDPHNRGFSRHVNLTHANRSWHADFHYFGNNVYAHLLAKYGAFVDFVSIQFYESYSRAGMSIHHNHVAPADYLQSYVNELVEMGESFPVDFEQDPAVNLPNQRVSLPLSKLVFGFANGWALDTADKAIFFDPESIEVAYRKLLQAGRAPRGFMYWVLGEEGTNGVFYTRALNDILQTRKTKQQPDERAEL